MEWYIDTMITLIERGGEFVTRDVWHSTVQLVSGCLACDQHALTCVYIFTACVHPAHATTSSGLHPVMLWPVCCATAAVTATTNHTATAL